MQNHVYAISEIIPNTDYLLFKKGIRPEWEDPYNKQGGKWVVTLPIEEDMEEECDEAWNSLVMSLVAGQFDYFEIINGAIFSIREKHYRITLWCNDNNNIPKVKRVGKQFKEMCKLPEKFKFNYQVHQKAINHELDNQAFLCLSD